MKKISLIFSVAVLSAAGIMGADAGAVAANVSGDETSVPHATASDKVSPKESIAPPDRANPFFGNTKNQIGLYVGQGTGGTHLLNLIWPLKWEYEPFNFFMLEYSRPFEFFTLHGRQNIHLGTTLGWGRHDGEDWRNYGWPMIGLSWDVAVVNWRGFYLGSGIGPFYKSGMDARMDSRFMFGIKVFAGYRLSDRFSAEVFTQHFSNGDLTPINRSYNFAGLGLLANF